MPSAPHGPSGSSKVVRARLDSWKEIADYLGKGERTAKRWAAERAMPVHHLPGGGRGSVFAFIEELDQWLLQERSEASNSSGNGNGNGSHSPAASDVQGRASPESFTLRSVTAITSGQGRLRRFVFYGALTIAMALFVAYATSAGTINASVLTLFRSLSATAKPATASSNPEKQLAHELYLRGRFEWSRRTPEHLNRALDYFTQSLVHDSANAQAYVGLADTYNLLREYALMPEREAYKRSIAAAKKAIELDDSLAEAHRSLAFGELYGNWDFETGEREFRRALELNPRDPLTHLWFANAFAIPGRYQESLREIDRAEELDPSSHAILADKGLMLYHSGETQKALELLKQVETSDPEFLSPHRYLAEVYRNLGDYPNFLRESEKVAQLSHDDVLKLTTAGARAGYERDGERGLWQELYRAQKKFHAEGRMAGTLVAMTCVRLGEKQEALRLLREDYDQHDSFFLMSRDNFDLLKLKDEPKYREIWSTVRLPRME